MGMPRGRSRGRAVGAPWVLSFLSAVPIFTFRTSAFYTRPGRPLLAASCSVEVAGV